MIPYFDFGHLGHDILFRPEGTEGISKYGYIILCYTGQDLRRTLPETNEVGPELPVIESNNDTTMLFEDGIQLPF